MQPDDADLSMLLSCDAPQAARVVAARRLFALPTDGLSIEAATTAFGALVDSSVGEAAATFRELAATTNDWRMLVLNAAILRHCGHDGESNESLHRATCLLEKVGDNAGVQFRALLMGNYRSSLAWLMMAWFCMGLELLDEAEECCNQAIGMKSQCPDAYYYKGLIYSRKTQMRVIELLRTRQEELKQLLDDGLLTKEALSRIPLSESPVVVDLGQIEGKKQSAELLLPPLPSTDDWYVHSEEARRFFDKAIELQPASARVWKSRGLLYVLGRFQGTRRPADCGEAVRCFNKATEIDPGDAESWAFLADSLMMGFPPDAQIEGEPVKRVADRARRKALALDAAIDEKVGAKLKQM